MYSQYGHWILGVKRLLGSKKLDISNGQYCTYYKNRYVEKNDVYGIQNI